MAHLNRMVDLMLGRAAFICGLLWLSALATMHIWPASWWLEVESVRVADGLTGQPVVMHVERKIHRNFTGTWGVTVRELKNEHTRIACASSAVTDYRIGTELPEVVTLGWWTNNQCQTLPAGIYIVHTAWQIHGSGILPAKTVQATSNPFKIYEGGPS